MKRFSLMILCLALFYSIAVSFRLIFDSIFYLANFIIIGTSCALGLGLWPVLSKKKKHIARKVSQVLVGGYMFLGLGCGLIYIAFGVIQPENMQIEGFWFLLLGGVFAASVMHYSIAKIAGPFLFGRAWCGWACWTAGVLDLLPWKKSPGRLQSRWSNLRYGLFLLSSVLVFVLVFAFGYTNKSVAGLVDLTGEAARHVDPEFIFSNLFLIPEFWWFVTGNLIYYASGIILAFALRDNRAFCKYVCPVTAFLKIGAHTSLLRIKGSTDCTGCRACEKNCPMDVKISEYVLAGKRVASTECILCFNCTNVCPKGLLKPSFGIDLGTRELLRKKNELVPKN